MSNVELETSKQGLIVVMEKSDPETGDIEYGTIELENNEDEPFVFKTKEKTWKPLTKDEMEAIVNG